MSGYGITGSYNTYINSKIRIGNFVEDAIGRELVDGSTTTKPTVYESVAMQAWVNPSDQVERTGPNHEKFRGSVRFMSKSEMQAKNKDGLSYPLLFSHGMGEVDITAKERYNSQLSIAFSPQKLSSSSSSSTSLSSPPLSAVPPVSVVQMRQKAKEVQRDVSVSTLRGNSEAKAANAFAQHSDAAAPRAVAGASEDLPNCGRRTLISGTFSPVKYR